MNELVKIIDEKEAVTTSLKVAEYFQKTHRHVMDRIRETIKKGVLHESNFRLMSVEIEVGRRFIHDYWKSQFQWKAIGGE